MYNTLQTSKIPSDSVENRYSQSSGFGKFGSPSTDCLYFPEVDYHWTRKSSYIEKVFVYLKFSLQPLIPLRIGFSILKILKFSPRSSVPLLYYYRLHESWYISSGGYYFHLYPCSLSFYHLTISLILLPFSLSLVFSYSFDSSLSLLDQYSLCTSTSSWFFLCLPTRATKCGH